jgi:Mrp family chromosome partitioning ATPase/uncharacterized protein involved in exopolysaccharide biosynthesis
MPMYGQFVQTQVQLLSSYRVITNAMQSDGWKELDVPFTDEAVEEFFENLSVRAIPGSEIIEVSFRHVDPRVASTAVAAVLASYSKIHLDDELNSEENQKIRQIQDRQRDLAFKLGEVEKQIKRETNSFGIDGFRSLHQMKVQRLVGLSKASQDLEIMIETGADSKPADSQMAEDGEGVAEPELTVAEIALRDSGMKALQRELKALQFDVDFRLKYFGENHPKKIEARELLARKQADIEAYASEYRAVAATMVAAGSMLQLAGATPEQLKARHARLEERIQAATDDVRESGEQMAKAMDLQRLADQHTQDIEQARRRLDLLNTEFGSTGGRIRIAPANDRAMMDNDTRVKYSAVGGVGGFSFGVALFLLAGLIDRRFRSVDDARTSVGQLTLLGVLPSLPEDIGDPEQAAVAAHCVHQIRTLLQITPAALGSRVFSVTSPASGTGKTSLTLALGVSFAAANSRTLLIDCDVIGGGLTARVDAIIRRKIGQVLRQQGHVSQQQLEAALRIAANSRKRVGEILVELGYITPDDVADALSLQQLSAIGLLDALGGEAIDDCIADTGIRDLSILPLGAASPTDVSKLSPAAIRRLIEQVRHRYDMVLVDTGPVPASLEASVAAAACDGVVIILSRGDHRPMAERCIQHLRDIGATVAGVVFNRAEARDMELSTTANRTSSVLRGAVGGISAGLTTAERVQSPNFGPIVTAVTGRSGASAVDGSNVEK